MSDALSDVKLSPVSALAEAPRGCFGGNGRNPALVMTACPEGTLLHILSAPAAKHAYDRIAAVLGETGLKDVRQAGPGQWFCVDDAPRTHTETEIVQSALSGIADVIDQSAGRVRIAVQGDHVGLALAKGIAIDLHPDQFTEGSSTITLCGQLSVHLTRTGADSFELIVLRSYARSLWDALIGMGREYGIKCPQQSAGDE